MSPIGHQWIAPGFRGAAADHDFTIIKYEAKKGALSKAESQESRRDKAAFGSTSAFGFRNLGAAFATFRGLEVFTTE